MGLWQHFFPDRGRDFFGLLVSQMEKTLEGVMVLEEYLHNKSNGTQGVMDRLQHEADEVRRVIIDDLNHTFITLIDRLDIYTLSRAVDDTVDHAASTGAEMEVYELTPDEYGMMISTNLKHAGKKLYDSICHLKERPNLSTEAALRSKLLINNMEHLYHEAIKELAENGDTAYMFKMREIYRRLFQIAESIRQANNILLDIVVKTM